MGIELEIKIQLSNHDAVRAALRQLDARYIGRFLETNTFFDTPTRALLASDQGLRLRISRDLESGRETYILTHKGPRAAGELKRRQETELTVASDKDAIALLQALGYEQTLTFEKKRESWTLDDCRIELDEAPYIGCFLEIEGPTPETIARVRQELNLSALPGIRAGYPTLLTHYLTEKGMPQSVIKFAPQQ